MTSTNKTILIADDDESLRRVTEYNLNNKGYRVLLARNGEEALRIFKSDDVDIVVTDIKMEKMDGLELLGEIKRLNKNALVIMITAYGSIDTAVRAMKLGAYDYIVKPFDRDELLIVIEKALNLQSLMSENVRLRQELTDRFRLDTIIGNSSKMRGVFDLVGRVAKSDTTVLLQGESGTGKELIARAIHVESSRAENPFIIVNCSAIPQNLMESEMFGYVKGAFTGAIKDKVGKFEAADGGTIFLDEVGDMDKDLQVKFLRVLQEKSIDKVGAAKNTHVDVRVITATNISLETAIKEGKFREDLFYRISVIPILLPPLRERKEDIPLLVQHLMDKHGDRNCQMLPETLDILQRYDWPGNVRELENVIERAIVLKGENDVIGPEDIPEHIKAKQFYSPIVREIPDEGINLEEIEKALIINALNKAGQNQTRAAELLDISRQTMMYRMRKYGIK
ncbi:MAG: sigma-54-dependent Fis family transcriptional regulator [Candidatus Scalindua sp. AMX11]|nr:MAG: sigma-54-dependent Fis family transcriptional regulator [Candidatus Scalindua sp.]NOG83396.1 sigma-54-dependent Fis family transcriptional regulator [Planctomycetota bacterium]RZV75091.1 MAG: sigma-54-dependent Fis family transcriptional regulator [Candidatus Scalindua sp. SCAELEC01]TDE63494.1 MAG: sigma-54-dependent Fis family transcriptional regulator [Candidatus Scalindua sp. AMX11]GJQ57277.1 MAG: acetoacetate metabolism regulatory protein AtoC [Candidatus Scalindua sp.]